MKIKNILFIILLMSFISSISFAQFTKSKVEEIEKLKQSTVIVAISDDEAQNKSAQEVMQSYWTASKFNIIKKSELTAYIKANPENYVLTYLIDNATAVHVKDNGKISSRTRTVGDGLILIKNLKKLKRLAPTEGMMYVSFAPDIDFINEQAEFSRMIGSMNAILTFPELKDNQINGWKIPTINQKEIITKELWVPNTYAGIELKEADLAKWVKSYAPYKYKKVTNEEIAKAIIDKRKDVVYIANVEYEVGRYLILVHSAEDNRVLFLVGGGPGTFKNIKENKPYGQ